MVYKMIDKVVTLAVTGASGSPYFINLLKNLLIANVKVNLLLSSAAKIVIKNELNLELPEADQDLKAFLLNYFSNDLNDVDY